MDWDGRTTREIIAAACAFDDECRKRDAESDQRLAQLMKRSSGDGFGLIRKTKEDSLVRSEPAPPFTALQRQIIGALISELRCEWRSYVDKKVAAIPAGKDGKDGRSIIGPPGPAGKDGVVIFDDQQRSGDAVVIPGPFIRRRSNNAA